jgi:hypothetical protein
VDGERLLPRLRAGFREDPPPSPDDDHQDSRSDAFLPLADVSRNLLQF